MSEFKNESKTREVGWIQSGSTNHELDVMLRKLKTVSTMDPVEWRRLAGWYKLNQRMEESEVAYLGCRYCDYENRDLMTEWLGVFAFNRWGEQTPEAILKAADSANKGLALVVNHEGRRLEELQTLLFVLDKPEART